MKKSPVYLLLPAILLALILGACTVTTRPATPTPEAAMATPPTAAAESLQNTMWSLAQLRSNDGKLNPLLPGTEITALFQDDQLKGKAGCNPYVGAYEIEGEDLALSTILSENKRCLPDEINVQENRYLQTLARATAFVVEDHQLRLLGDEGLVTLVYSAVEPPALTEETWQLIAFNDGEALVSNFTSMLTTAAFGIDGRVTGFAGCNNYAAPYEREDTSITIEPVMVTRRSCSEPKNVMADESSYLDALEKTARYELASDALTLYDADGLRMAIFRPALDKGATSDPPQDVVRFDARGLATKVEREVVRDTSAGDDATPAPGKVPAYQEYSFDGDARMWIFPIADFMAMEETSGDEAMTRAFAALQDLLDEGLLPLEPPLPVLPPADAPNDLAVQTTFLSFFNGEGIRFVGRHVDEATAVVNEQLDYYFQGKTGDDIYYISIIWPVSTDLLPDTGADVTKAQAERAAEDAKAYWQETTYALNTLAPQDWDPDLSQLDAMARSINIFDPEEAARSGLVGKVWQWQAFSDPAGNQSIVDEPAAYLLGFDEYGHVFVQADCNATSGAYALSGSSLKLQLTPTSLASCGPQSLSAEYLRTLSAASSYVFESGNLFINLFADGGGLRFAPGKTQGNEGTEGTIH